VIRAWRGGEPWHALISTSNKMTKNYEWHKIADSEEEIVLAENGIAVIEVKDKKICLTKFQEQWFGFPYKCPHAGGLLANGYIDLIGNIVCPLHRYKFSLKNGRDSNGEGYYMKTYAIKLRTDGVFVALEQSNWLNFLE
jgi:nitrite reductase/ring-hydroxylating ferredoxin subunit